MKRCWPLLAALLIAGGGCRAETPNLTDPITYVAVGASDTVGVGAPDPDQDAWVALLSKKLPKGSTFVRLGVSGSTASQALVEQVPRAEKADADLVTVWLAVNDFNERIDVGAYGSTLTKILERLRAGDAAVYVGNVPDLSLVPIYKAIPKVLMNRRINDYNEAIASAAGKTGAHVVDLYELSQELARDGDALISEDGFHPSEEGYRLIADAFWEAIQKDRAA